eukprot:TRINITY_DN6971_c0_g2_i1.p1 TRINITY_DN6971_c0_g2~~TRINITY_DN6971_c0_g2_i1.p1  ORF type:complete len:164 (+),score=43.30 TRINITY_DN6971_c0_g2_i1:114-605(+)
MSEDRGKDRKRDRSRSRRRRRDDDDEEPKEKAARREKEIQKKEEEMQAREQARLQDEEEQERIKLADQAKRMDRTVMIMGLSPRADERDIFEFFSGRAGTVRDVQIIRDARTGRSKGVAYVEFGSAEAMVKSLGLSGQSIKGHKVMVQQSQSDPGRGTHASRG